MIKNPDTLFNNVPFYHVVVIGAGPGGAEAAMAAARNGARTLCLTINLDNAGFHPGAPMLVEDEKDARGALLDEIEILRGMLPRLLRSQGVAAEGGTGSENNFRSRLVIDRRILGLAYKEAVESQAGLELRQALVTSVEPADLPDGKTGWMVTGNLGEKFAAACVVVAAGTFLKGIVVDGGDMLPGGRRGEIPANALALWLQNLGCKMVEVAAWGAPRMAKRSIGSAPQKDCFISDGSQLGEVTVVSRISSVGNSCKQLLEVRQDTGRAEAWLTRSAYRTRHLVLQAEQAGAGLESLKRPGLFFAGRVAGSFGFTEAAALGVVAGTNAAARALEREPMEAMMLSNHFKFVDKLCYGIAHDENRQVSLMGVSTPPPGKSSRVNNFHKFHGSSSDGQITNQKPGHCTLESN